MKPTFGEIKAFVAGCILTGYTVTKNLHILLFIFMAVFVLFFLVGFFVQSPIQMKKPTRWQIITGDPDAGLYLGWRARCRLCHT